MKLVKDPPTPGEWALRYPSPVPESLPFHLPLFSLTTPSRAIGVSRDHIVCGSPVVGNVETIAWRVKRKTMNRVTTLSSAVFSLVYNVMSILPMCSPPSLFFSTFRSRQASRTWHRNWSEHGERSSTMRLRAQKAKKQMVRDHVTLSPLPTPLFGAFGRALISHPCLLPDGKNKKRKLEPASKVAPPTKKQVTTVGAKPSSTVGASPASVKKEPVRKPLSSSSSSSTTTTVSSAPAVKDAKSDSSFFSAPKPKPKLPSFNKRGPHPSTAAGTNVAQPSSVDPFQEALAAMKSSARRDSPAQNVTPPPPAAAGITSAAGPSTPGPALSRSGKRKRVTWAAPDQLEKVKLITRAIYDDDPMEVRGVFTVCPWVAVRSMLIPPCARSLFSSTG
jgi:hypothetical protein